MTKGNNYTIESGGGGGGSGGGRRSGVSCQARLLCILYQANACLAFPRKTHIFHFGGSVITSDINDHLLFYFTQQIIIAEYLDAAGAAQMKRLWVAQ